MERRAWERKTFRRPIRFEVGIKKQEGFSNIECEGESIDISQGGLGLITDYELKEGDVLKLMLPVGALDIAVPVFAEAVWRKCVNNRFRAGLRFLM